MNVLVIGGAGSVASVVIPHLRKLHTLRVFDLRPPADASLAHVVGNVGDYEALKAASTGMDAILYMAMGHLSWDEPIGFTSAFDANVKGVYVALRAAHSAGVPHAVYTSSMSVFEGDLLHRYFYDEEQPADGTNIYAMTKKMGEDVCRNAWQLRGTSVNALRMCFPITDERWQTLADDGAQNLHTSARDLSRLFDSALAYRNGFQIFTTSGDYAGKWLNMRKAKRELGWEPLARPTALLANTPGG